MYSNLNNTKRINYRGILSFELPRDWIEEYDDELGAAFYKDLEDSATLRLSLISLKAPSDIGELNAVKVLDKFNSKESKIITLTNNNAYKMYYERTIDEGNEITIFYWYLAQVIKPSGARLAVFSYTFLSNQLEKKSIQQEIEFITEQVKKAEFVGIMNL